MWDEIDRKLGFEGFGRNLDALVDVLRGGFGHFTVDEYAKLVVFGKDVAAAHCDRWPTRWWRSSTSHWTASMASK